MNSRFDCLLDATECMNNVGATNEFVTTWMGGELVTVNNAGGTMN